MSNSAVALPIVRAPPIPIPLRYSRSPAHSISMMVIRRPDRRPAAIPVRPMGDFRSLNNAIVQGLDTLSDLNVVPSHDMYPPLDRVASQLRTATYEYVDDTVVVGRSASDVMSQFLCCDLRGCNNKRWPGHRFCGKTHARMSTQWIYRIQSAVMASSWMLFAFGIAPMIYGYVCAAIFLAQQLGYAPI